MKVQFAGTWITGAAFQEEAGDAPLEASQKAGAVPLVRSAAPYLRALGNRASRIPVTVYLACGGAAEAAAFLHALASSLPSRGTLRIVEDHGGMRLVIRYADATFADASAARAGESVAVSVAFLAASEPEATIYDPAETLETLAGDPIHAIDGTPITAL